MRSLNAVRLLIWAVLLRAEVFEMVQEDSTAVVSNGNILAPCREVHARDMPERSARGRPVGECRERWEVDLCGKTAELPRMLAEIYDAYHTHLIFLGITCDGEQL